MVKKKVVYLPYEVNPLIKFLRWTFLIVGVVCGFKNQKKYYILETALREEEEKLRSIKEPELAREKAIRDELELQEMEKLFLNSSFAEKDQENLVNQE